MTKYIIATILGIASVISANADMVKAPMLPQRHEAAVNTETQATNETARNFIERAYDSARSHSPFATVQPVEVASRVNLKLADQMINYAAKFLGTRYILGATGPKAFDCSGFTSYVFRNFGITLNRTSRMQYLQGEKVSPKNLQPGDLLFFSCRSSGRGNVGHVAMVVDVDPETRSCTFIHASVKKGVTYQKFPDNGYFDRHFIGAKRILGTKTHKAS